MPGHRGEPGTGHVGYAVATPSLEGARKRVLGALLGQVPVAGQRDQGRDDPAPLGREGLLERARGVYISQTGLTSIAPKLDAGTAAATAIASSRSAQSTMK